jgi:hypothetical protein
MILLLYLGIFVVGFVAGYWTKYRETYYERTQKWKWFGWD